jgi:uncharacterized protein YegJ (DUF2314 family)
MLAASQRARDTLDSFIERITLSDPPSSRSIRARVGSGAGAEPIWLDEPVFRNGSFRAVVGNLPGEVPGVEIGDAVVVSRSEVLDWLFVEERCMAGAYTLRVDRARMTDAERADLDRSLLVPFCE